MAGGGWFELLFTPVGFKYCKPLMFSSEFGWIFQ